MNTRRGGDHAVERERMFGYAGWERRPFTLTEGVEAIAEWSPRRMEKSCRIKIFDQRIEITQIYPSGGESRSDPRRPWQRRSDASTVHHSFRGEE